MYYSLNTITLLAALSILFVACAESEEKSNTPSKDLSSELQFTRSVSFLSNTGDTLSTIKAAVADDSQERNQGLMDVRNLPESMGMIFIFEENAPRSFWMANTPLSLDIMFVNADYEIVRIHRSTQPYSSKSLESGKPAKYVIETNAGYSISHDIQEGMKVTVDENL